MARSLRERQAAWWQQQQQQQQQLPGQAENGTAPAVCQLMEDACQQRMTHRPSTAAAAGAAAAAEACRFWCAARAARVVGCLVVL